MEHLPTILKAAAALTAVSTVVYVFVSLQRYGNMVQTKMVEFERRLGSAVTVDQLARLRSDIADFNEKHLWHRSHVSQAEQIYRAAGYVMSALSRSAKNENRW